MKKEKKHHTLRAFLGFLLTVFIIINLVFYGLAASLSHSVFKHSKIKDILNDIKVYDLVYAGSFGAVRDAYGDTENIEGIVDDIIPKSMINEISDLIIESICDGKEIDLTPIKNKYNEYLIDRTDDIALRLVNELKKSNTVIKRGDLVKNPTIIELEKEFDIDISKDIEDLLLGDKEQFDLSLVAEDTVNSGVVKVVADVVAPAYRKAFNNFMDAVSNSLNHELSNDQSIHEAAKSVEGGVSLFKLLTTLTIIFVVFLCAIMIFAYRADMHKATRNIGIAFLIPALLQLVYIFVLSVSKSTAFDDLDKKYASYKEFFELLQKNIFDPIIGAATTIGMIYLVVAITGIGLTFVIKNMKNN